MEDNTGHRKRVKEKYSKQGEGAFYDYELLEMLLFYSIPRKDTKHIAKALLKKFGSMDNLLNADVLQISSVDEVGTETARLIKLVVDINKRALDSREKQTAVTSGKQAGEYFRRLLENEATEKFAVMLMDNGGKIIYSGIISEGTVSMADVSIRKLTNLVLIYGPTSLIIAHNHPRGLAEASDSDVNTTLAIREFMKKLEVTLSDHIIIGENGVYSMRHDINCNKYFEQ